MGERCTNEPEGLKKIREIDWERPYQQLSLKVKGRRGLETLFFKKDRNPDDEGKAAGWRQSEKELLLAI